MTHLMTACLAAVLLMHGPALAQNLTEWDLDDDGIIAEVEFDQGFSNAGLFDEWDGNADGQIVSAELAEGFYGFWDRDDDDSLSVTEWDNAVDQWLGESALNLQVSEWDSNGDDVISEFEFAAAFERADLISEFDSNADDLLDEPELATGLFVSADHGDDAGILIEEEGFFDEVAEIGEALDDPIEPTFDLIEAGRAYTELPIPCGANDDCPQVASDFCSALGYGDPIDILAVESQLYVIRCTDDPMIP